MTGRDFTTLLSAKWAEGKLLCVGLDPDLDKLPESVHMGGPRPSLVAFNRAIIDATKDIVCAFKPNSAFYEAYGDEGFAALRETVRYCIESAPDVPVILDAKRGDIGNTNDGYAESAFEHIGVDAITVHPYLGREALEPFLARKDKGIFVLCRTSNGGAKEFQDLVVEGTPLYQVVASHVASVWNGGGNCGLVVGATYPEDLAKVRAIAPQLPILLPGIGAQGGDLAKSVAAGATAQGGLIISSSRATLYASSGKDFAEAAREQAQNLDSAIRKVR